jgi:hypothetical protein
VASLVDGSGVEACPLLDIGTLNDHFPGQGYRYQAVLYPTVGEASVRFSGRSGGRLDPKPEDHLARSVRRSRSALRRFCVHNGLGYMPTLTFRSDPLSRRGVASAVELFRRRLVRAGVDEPYSWVIERGEANGRLHVHFACAWWGRLAAVEVCDRCATAGLRAVRSDIPPRDAFCVGCLWGQGFVGAPTECVGDPRGVAVYVSKYAAKELGLTDAPGVNRYHVPRGHQPPVVRVGAPTFEGAVRGVTDVANATLECSALHEVVEDWKGPPLWAFRWDLSQGGETLG